MLRKTLVINGASRSFLCDEQETLAEVLRRLGLTGTKVACGMGQCGACNVIVDGELVRSCTKKVVKVADDSVVETIEGLGTANNLHPLQQAWITYGGVQCGFCSPGFILSAKVLLAHNPDPTREEVRAWFQKNRNACRCTGYKPLVDAVIAAAKVMRGEATMDDITYHHPEGASLLNTRAPKPSALGKVLGTTDFGADVALKADMLQAAMVTSPIMHGRIKSMDFSEAEKAPGVVRIVTAKDVKGINRITFPLGSAYAVGDGFERPIICYDKVVRLGDCVAVVVADTKRHAREAVKLVKVEYEELPGYDNALDAIAPDAVEIHENTPNMFIQKPLFKGEDTREIMANASHTVELAFSTPPQGHLPLEPENAQGYMDKDGTLVILCKTHGVYMSQGLIAAGLGLPPEKIRIIKNPAGGAFGSSLSPGLVGVLGATVMAVGAPVSLELTWAEHQLFDPVRSGSFSNVRIAADENGKMTAAECNVAYDKGAYSEYGSITCDVSLRFFMYPYYIPSARALSACVYTNTSYSAAYRCFASPELYTNTELAMELLADKVGMDPFDFRRMNVLSEGDDMMWSEKPDIYPMPAIMDAIKPKYDELLKHAKENTTDEKKYGVGITAGGFLIDLSPDHAEVNLELNNDNTFTIFHTAEDMGQGADIVVLAQLMEGFKPMGVTLDRIHVVESDTGRCPDTGIAGGSRMNFATSVAIDDACKKMMANMQKEDGSYRTYDEMVAEGIPTKVTGVIDLPPNPNFSETNGHGAYSAFSSYIAFVAEVEVDVATGTPKVIDVHCVTDVGTTSNILALEGQAYGGMEHSVGYALTEDRRDPKKYTSFIQSGFPFIELLPDGDNFTFKNLATWRDYSPTGTSGASEAFQASAHAAIINAIYRAVGIVPDTIPLTPARIKEMMDAKAAGTFEKQELFDFGFDFDERLDDMYENPRIMEGYAPSL